MWMKGLIKQFIPKDKTLDLRNPISCRWITLACAMCKWYCGDFNTRLVGWAKGKGLIEVQQNGFRTDRSCVDHLSSHTNIIETPMLYLSNPHSTLYAMSYYVKFQRLALIQAENINRAIFSMSQSHPQGQCQGCFKMLCCTTYVVVS